jgi:hypothetical protein
MSTRREFDKDPNSTLDFGIDWTLWLNGDVITASSWILPAGITKTTDTFSAVLTMVWLSGGTARNSYQVTNTITTAAGRIAPRTLIIHVREM